MIEALNAAVIRAQNKWFHLRNDESGQTLVEYALIIAIVALGAIVALVFLKDEIAGLFSKTGNKLHNAPVS